MPSFQQTLSWLWEMTKFLNDATSSCSNCELMNDHEHLLFFEKYALWNYS